MIEPPRRKDAKEFPFLLSEFSIQNSAFPARPGDSIHPVAGIVADP
jgi:hypothetical protein